MEPVGEQEYDPYAGLEDDDAPKPEDGQPPPGPMLAFIGGGEFTPLDTLLRQCDIFRACVPALSERVCLGGEFALYAMDCYLGVKTGLDLS